jgi:DNA-binding LacI/PurR family transcriptional regulator
LRKGRSGIIGLWIPDQISIHYTHVARELNRLVKTTGHELIISEVSIAEEQQMLSHVPMDGIFIVDAPEQAKIDRKIRWLAQVSSADNGDGTSLVTMQLQSPITNMPQLFLCVGIQK